MKIKDTLALIVLFIASLGLVGISYWVLDSRSKVAGVDTENQDQYTTIQGITLPHHGLAGSLIAESVMKLEGPYETIVILSPNHFHPEKGHFTSKKLNGFKVNERAVDGILESGALVNESEEILLGEHGVMVLIPFLAEQFPEAEFVPLILSNQHKESDLVNLREYFNRLNSKTLYVASVDFAHTLMLEEALEHNNESIQAIENFDYATINQFDDLHMDNRVGVSLLMRVMSDRDAKSWETWISSHGALLEKDPALQGTSYVIGVFR